MNSKRAIDVGPVSLGEGHPLVLIAGMCVIESRTSLLAVARRLVEICDEAGVPLVFKASFDKANRSSISAYRGPGLERGLEILAELRETLNVPVTTDVHLPSQAEAVAGCVDLLQVPAFLCRQTDLLVACAETGKPVNVKKGQFLSPQAMALVIGKLESAGSREILLTERGTQFGYGDLVVDMRAIPQMKALGVPVCFDATHAVQRPGAAAGSTGGDRHLAPSLARAAVAVGIDALFVEVHPNPDQALSDGPNSLELESLPGLLPLLTRLDRMVKGGDRG
jgi:2-dehydro-3-deoxyphosphooctonate aldolase (KDO 8-P synthase)